MSVHVFHEKDDTFLYTWFYRMWNWYIPLLYISLLYHYKFCCIVTYFNLTDLVIGSRNATVNFILCYVKFCFITTFTSRPAYLILYCII